MNSSPILEYLERDSETADALNINFLGWFVFQADLTQIMASTPTGAFASSSVHVGRTYV